MAYNIWKTLGIEPAKDKKIIQQAYAEKIKLHHPEEDPEGFKSLQNAYRSAVAYTKDQSIQSDDTWALHKRVKQQLELCLDEMEMHKDLVLENTFDEEWYKE